MSEPAVPAFETTAQKVARWRLTVLTREYGATHSSYDADVFLQLDRLADSKSDLWQIVKALRAGCTLELAVAIFADDINGRNE